MWRAHTESYEYCYQQPAAFECYCRAVEAPPLLTERESVSCEREAILELGCFFRFATGRLSGGWLDGDRQIDAGEILRGDVLELEIDFRSFVRYENGRFNYSII